MVIVAARHIVLTQVHLLSDRIQPQPDVSHWLTNGSTPQRYARAQLRHSLRRRNQALRTQGDGRYRRRLRQGRKCSLFSTFTMSEH
jgi:hypothetical protein